MASERFLTELTSQRPTISPPTGFTRPKFNSRITSDRLREGSGTRPLSCIMTSNIRKGRKSIFKELGLDDDLSDDGSMTTPVSSSGHKKSVSMSSMKEFLEITGLGSENETDRNRDSKDENPQQRPRQQGMVSPRLWYSKFTSIRRPRIKTSASAPPPTASSLTRFAMIVLLIAVVLPGFGYNNGDAEVEMSAADAGVLPREMTPTQVCTRWSQQVALVNGTLYIYGGQAKSSPDQTTDTWNNYFLTLDTTKSWDISSPALTGLEIPNGPPKVANGYLWHDFDNIYLYGGEFADNPYQTPSAESLWRYSCSGHTWTEFKDLTTSSGNNSEGSGQQVHRSAEGAGLSVPELGLSWYFGGHLDLATTPGWSNQIARVYLKSLLEWTHPGYVNDGVDKLKAAAAADSGAFRNITQGGLQATDAFPERADGALVFVPGWGQKGVLIGLGGGTNDTFVRDLSVLDVFDIANSEWYHQETRGDAPGVRVNPCAVIASAPDASSFQIYVFGGQNLLPFKEQTQYDDMYVLSIPAFTWFKVPKSGQNAPSPRAGHTCTMRDGQIVVVGGYVGREISCDSPGIYVFDASTLQWQDKFRAGDHEPDYSSDNSVKAASFNYKVPEPVAQVIGGDGDGGATVTTPAAGPATGGPFATGKPPVYTITENGQTATITQFGDATGVFRGPKGSDDSNDPSPGLIAAGVIAGILGLLAGYLGFCAWLYSRQVRAYRQHLAVANRYSGLSTASLTGPAAAAAFRRSRAHRRDGSTTSDDSFGWVGAVEPKWLSDEPTPGSGTGTGTGSGSGSGFGLGSGSRLKSEDQRGDYGAVGEEGGGRPGTSGSDRGSASSAERLLEGQEPSFFSVVMGPRRALRVVNGMENEG